MGEVKTTALKQRTKSNMKDLFFIVLGILSYSVGYTAFILPEKVVMGGASGIAALVFYATEIPTWISLAVINCTLLLIALKELNLQFIIRTVEMDQMMFIRSIAPRSFVFSVALTMLFNFAVCLLMRRHVRQISMVESMKAPE